MKTDYRKTVMRVFYLHGVLDSELMSYQRLMELLDSEFDFITSHYVIKTALIVCEYYVIK